MLPPEDPRAGLRRLFRRHEPVVGPPPADLEARLLAQHRQRYPAKARGRGLGGFTAFLGAHRFAAAGVAIAVVAGACQLPAEYERSFGVSFTCAIVRATATDHLPDLADRLAAAIDAESLSLRVHDDGGPTIAVRIDAWGPSEDHEATLAAIRDAAPVLHDASCETETLAGTVRGTLGGRLGYALLDLDIDRKGAALTRAEIREQLRAQGFTGTVEVEVEAQDGQHRVEIRLEQHHASEAESLEH